MPGRKGPDAEGAWRRIMMNEEQCLFLELLGMPRSVASLSSEAERLQEQSLLAVEMYNAAFLGGTEDEKEVDAEVQIIM